MANTDERKPQDETCPKCGSPLGEITITKTGRKLQRCSKGSWDAETKKNVGCDYVKWFEIEPEILDEKCPKCSSSHTCNYPLWEKDEKVLNRCLE